MARCKMLLFFLGGADGNISNIFQLLCVIFTDEIDHLRR